MTDFFPQGFWAGVAIVGIAIFIVFGTDLIFFKARFVTNVSRFVNKSFHVDEAVIRLLENLKKTSDRQFDVEHTLLHGWGRFVAGGVLIGAAFVLFNLLPVLK